MTRLNNQKGFSLIETMMSAIFLSISVLGLSTLSVTTIKATRDATIVTDATNLARNKIDDLRSAGYAASSGSDLGPGSGPVDQDEPSPQTIYTRNWTVSAGPTADTRAVSVLVSWSSSGPQQVVLETLIAQ